ARAMIDDGLFTRFPKPDVVLGQHVMVGPAGTVAGSAGPITSAADSLQIHLFGRGAHGSMPQASVDPVVMAAAIVWRLQTIVSRPTASGTPDQRRRARTSAASGVNGTRRQSTGLSAAPIPTSMPKPRPREGSTTCRSITAPCSALSYIQPCRQALRPWSRAR